MNAAAVDMKALALEERASHGPGAEEQAPVMAHAEFALQGESDGSLARRGDVVILGNLEEHNPLLGRVLANTTEAIPWSISPEGDPNPGIEFDSLNTQVEEIAGTKAKVTGLMSGAGIWVGPAATDAMLRESIPDSNSSIWVDAGVGLGQPGDHAPAEPLAMNDVLERIREDGTSLTDPSSLFPPSSGSPTDFVPLSLDRDGKDSWDRGRMPTAESYGSRGPAGMGEDLWRTGAVGRQTESETDSISMGRESIDELTSRLLATTERLAAVAQQLVSAAPRSLASSPRPFRGRVDG